MMRSIAFLAILALAFAAPAQEEGKEKRQLSTARPINVRLSASDYHYGGRLEIQMAGVWGSVCAVGVDARFAAVVCRQLGLGHSGDVITDSRLGYYPNSPPEHIWIDSIRCEGNELHLEQCHIAMYGHAQSQCDHSHDVSIMCHSNTVDYPSVPTWNNDVSYHPLPSPHIPMALRLTGGTRYEGRLEIRVQGIWKSVCDDHWDNLDAGVACRQMGFLAGEARPDSYYYYGEGLMEVWMDDVTCTGAEQSLEQCAHTGYGVHDCVGNIESAAVRCIGEPTPYQPVPPPYVPPQPQPLPPNTMPVRLYGSPHHNEGLVEVQTNGVWKHVCGDNWEMPEATVVCRQLGYPGGRVVDDTYQVTTLDFWTKEAKCTGYEATLDTCPAMTYGPSFCTSHRRAAVSCTPSNLPPYTPTQHPAYSSNVRLVSGTSEMGLVLLDFPGVTGHICAEAFHTADANVICRQLMFNRGDVIQHATSIFGPAVAPVVMTGLACVGNEHALNACPTDYRSYSCAPNDIAAVRCYYN